MADSLAHRGPDGEGIFTDDSGAPSVGLASRRLAVIDIPGGRQPMSTEDGAYTIVYNGELFNARRDPANARNVRPSVPLPLRHGGRSARLRGVGRRGPRPPQRDVGVRDLGRAPPAAVPRARPARGEAARLRATRRTGSSSARRSRRSTASGLVERALDHDGAAVLPVLLRGPGAATAWSRACAGFRRATPHGRRGRGAASAGTGTARCPRRTGPGARRIPR